MEEAKPLFKVVDKNDTLIKPLEANYEVMYKYEGEQSYVKVEEGVVRQGEAEKNKEFPAKEAEKVLEEIDIKVIPVGPTGWNAYSERTKIMSRQATAGIDAKIPEKGESVELEAVNTVKPTKEQLITITKTAIENKKAALTANTYTAEQP